MLNVAKRHDGGFLGDGDPVAIAVEHFTHEADDVLVLAAVLIIGEKGRGVTGALLVVCSARARPRQAHALDRRSLLPHQQLGRASAEEHVAVAIEEHRAQGIAVDEVDQDVFRGKRLVGDELDAARGHDLLNAALLDARHPHAHHALPLLERIAHQAIRHAAMRARRRLSSHTRESFDAALVYGPQAVHLKEGSLLALSRKPLREA